MSSGLASSACAVRVHSLSWTFWAAWRRAPPSISVIRDAVVAPPTMPPKPLARVTSTSAAATPNSSQMICVIIVS
jgi:hypothetical protein